MALTEEDALKRAERLRLSQRTQRSVHAAVWAVNMAYAHGRQWQFVRHQLGGGRKIHQLREIIDPRRSDVRVSLDIIRPIIERTVAATSPQKIVPQIIPRDGRRESMIAKHVYDAVLAEKLPAIRALEMWRSLQWPRAVLGTVCVRRTIKKRGKDIVLPVESKTRSGERLRLRNLSVGWAKILPWELMRNPSVRDFDIDISDVDIGQEKPRTLQWIKRNFDKTIQTETTFGQLMEFQDQLIRASGWGNRYLHSSQSDHVPAVMVYEFFFKDADEQELWPWQLIAYAVNKPDGSALPLTTLQFGKNPFAGQPFSLIHYSKPVQGPWADGIPQLLKAVQDVTNLAITTMTRTMMDQGSPKWLYQVGTVDDPSKAFTNRSDMPIAWRKTTGLETAPERITAAQTSTLTGDVLAMTQERAMLQANLAPIQFGQQVRRGQSGEAYREVGAQADAVVENRRVDDQLVLNDLIYKTLQDEVKLKQGRMDLVVKMLEGRFPKREILAAFAVNPKVHVREVRVIPDSLRPRTPRQIQELFTTAHEQQLISSDTTKYEMHTRGGITLDTIMAGAVRRQQLEIESIIKGEEASLDIAESKSGHIASLQVLAAFFASERRYTISDEQADALTQHWALHKQALAALIQFDAQGIGQEGAQPGMASQPAQQSPLTQPGAVESAVAV